jgi:hypothetical protein
MHRLSCCISDTAAYFDSLVGDDDCSAVFPTVRASSQQDQRDMVVKRQTYRGRCCPSTWNNGKSRRPGSALQSTACAHALLAGGTQSGCSG